jgi:hypothetical protein
MERAAYSRREAAWPSTHMRDGRIERITEVAFDKPRECTSSEQGESNEAQSFTADDLRVCAAAINQHLAHLAGLLQRNSNTEAMSVQACDTRL